MALAYLAASTAQITAAEQQALPAFSSLGSSGQASLEGAVIDTTTAAAVPNVTLRLRSAAPTQQPADNQGALKTVSDARGNFRLINIPSEAYFLSAERINYVTQRYGSFNSSSGGKLFAFSEEQHLNGVILMLTPAARIAGSITGAEDGPIRVATVQVLRIGYINGRKQLLPAGGAAADIDGKFKSDGSAPGRYYIKVDGNPAAPFPLVTEQTGQQDENDAFLTTYYPSTTDLASALPVDVFASMQLEGLKVVLRRSRVFAIRGRVRDQVTGGPPVSLALTLLPSHPELGSALLEQRRTMVRSKDGAFEFRFVPPGSYIVQPFGGMLRVATAPPEATATSSKRVGCLAVTVTDEDVENILLSVGLGATIVGAVKVDEMEGQPASGPTTTRLGSPTPSAPLPLIRLRSADGFPDSTVSAHCNSDGSFSLEGILPGRFHVSVSNVSNGMYVRSIHLGETDVTGFILDLSTLTEGRMRMEVLVSPHATALTGTVRNQAGDIVRDATVSLWSARPASHQISDSVRVTTTDNGGTFRFQNLPVGAYRVVAWEEIDPGLARNWDLCEFFEDRSPRSQLDKDGHVNVELHLTLKDAIEAAKNRLP